MQHFQGVAFNLVFERHRPRRDMKKIAELEAEAAQIVKATGANLDKAVEGCESWFRTTDDMRVRDELIATLRRDPVDQEAAAAARQRFAKRSTRSYDPKYTRDQIERIGVEVELEKLDRALTTPETAAQRAELERRMEELSRRDGELRARMGDPLIAVDAPADSSRVIAIMPDGEVKPLIYNADRKRWEARFDIPTYAAEGEYVISVVVVRADGTRQVLAIRYRVDLTAPAGRGMALRIEGGLRLDIEASEDTARVEAILPSGVLLSLKRLPGSNRFFTLAHDGGSEGTVTYILTDRAHNRMTITVNMSDREAAR
jgi:hypothetical protein